MRLSTVESSTGMGLPSAVDETRVVEDGFGWEGFMKENGKALLRGLGAAWPGRDDVSDVDR